MKRTSSRRFVATLVTGAAVALACAAFAQRNPGAESPEVAGAVKAGVDRVVILGGKTYLCGELSGALAEEGDSATVAWSNRVKDQIVNWIPHLIDKLNNPELPEGGINNFVAAADKLARKPHAGHIGHVASDAWLYNTLASIRLAVLVDPQGDPEILKAQKAMRATLEHWIPKIPAGGVSPVVITLGEQEEAPCVLGKVSPSAAAAQRELLQLRISPQNFGDFEYGVRFGV